MREGTIASQDQVSSPAHQRRSRAPADPRRRSRRGFPRRPSQCLRQGHPRLWPWRGVQERGGGEGDRWRVCGDSEPVTRQRMVPNSFSSGQLFRWWSSNHALPSFLSPPPAISISTPPRTTPPVPHQFPRNPDPTSVIGIFPSFHPQLPHFLPSPAYQLPPSVLG